MLSLTLASIALLLTPTTFPTPLDTRWSDSDRYYGKKLAPSNYSIVHDIFIQDSAAFNGTGYNLLNDSFGLFDKSPGRWQSFTKSVSF